ncbi:MAG: aminoglycoside phosphotransferase family protein [Deltaproteobacteria bacterium]|nr:aminoglycoside phosphotransferase family protein [Deltaproteobacteria bacterium]
MLAELDFQFGWRWLLPIQEVDRVAFLGFSKPELGYWEQALFGATMVSNPENATVWIVNADEFPVGDRADLGKVGAICVVGRGSSVTAWYRRLAGQYPVVREYGLMSPRNPRVVVPLSSPSHISSALSIHRPGRLLARIGVIVLKGLAAGGILRPLRARSLCIAIKNLSTLPQGARLAGFDLDPPVGHEAFALYLGTPDDNRKTVVLSLGCGPQLVLKCGETPKAHAALRNEAAALVVLSRTPLAGQVPALLGVVEQGGMITLHLEYRPRQRVSANRLMQAAADFLVELSRIHQKYMPLSEILEHSELITCGNARQRGWLAYAEVRVRLEALARGGLYIWGNRIHGDFAPWNCEWTKEGFFVFDWEESREWGMALTDAFYFMVARAVHVSRFPGPRNTAAKAMNFARDVALKADVPIEDISVYWALWLLQRTSQQPAPLYHSLLEGLAVRWN